MGDEVDVDAYCSQRGLSPEECAACTRSMVGSIKIGHKKHLLLCLKTEPASWIADINEEGVAAMMSRAIKSLEAPVILTGVHHQVQDASNPEDIHVIVYPDACLYTLPGATTDFVPFVQELLAPPPSTATFPKAPAPWSTLILVCAHQARDNRCGRAGPQVIEELRTQLAQRGLPETDICVRASSHLGGHKFAGILVVYPLADWYGMITQRNVGDLLDCVINGKKYLKGWRGNESRVDGVDW